MTAQPGKDILVKIDTTGGGSYSVMAGGRTKSISMGGEQIDITNSDSVNMHRESLDVTGELSMEVSFQGVFTDASVHDTARTDFMAQTLRLFELTIPDFHTITGKFKISQITYEGEYNGEAQFSMTLVSSGEMTFAAI